MNPPDLLHSIHLELRIDGTAPTGHASLDGGDPRAFSGWVGLVSTVEELVTEGRERAQLITRAAASAHAGLGD